MKVVIEMESMRYIGRHLQRTHVVMGLEVGGEEQAGGAALAAWAAQGVEALLAPAGRQAPGAGVAGMVAAAVAGEARG